ncbi:MAG: adenylate kinase [Clostridia bacterium]|nr:adenylate kinase [Clostridia bacterium]
MKLVFLGPPGAGKGTQAAGVAKAFDIVHISTGDMFRAAIRNQTPTGLRAKAFMDAGELVPDAVVIEMVKERLAQDDCKNGYLLDGFPRTVEQAEALDGFCPPDAVVDLEVPDEALLARLTGRRVCVKCQGIFHISKLADETVCPVCGAELIHRDDDKPEAIQTRLNVYHAQTSPLVGYYRNNGKLRPVSGVQAPEAVTKEILSVLRGDA